MRDDKYKYQNLSDADLEFLIAAHEPKGTDLLEFWDAVREKERRRKLQIELALAPHRSTGHAHVFDPKTPRYFSAQAAKSEVIVFVCDKGGHTVSLSIHPEEAFALAMILIRAGLQARAHRDQPATALVSNSLDLEAA